MRGVLPGGRCGRAPARAAEDPRGVHGHAGHVPRRPHVQHDRLLAVDQARPPRHPGHRRLPGRPRTEEQTSAFQGQGAWSPVTTAATPGARDRGADRPHGVHRQGADAVHQQRPEPGPRALRRAGLARRAGRAGLPGRPARACSPVPSGYALGALGSASFARVVVERGMVTVKRNGYLMAPESLDEFATAACVLADGLAAWCLDGHRPAAVRAAAGARAPGRSGTRRWSTRGCRRPGRTTSATSPPSAGSRWRTRATGTGSSPRSRCPGRCWP